MFDECDVIYSYTRKQALEDGVLVGVTDVAKEAGFKWPVAVTSAVWAMIENLPKNSMDSPTARLWDVLFMAYMAIRRNGGGTELRYQLELPQAGTRKRLVTLKLVTGPGDDMEPVVTIMLPDED
jgi:hypothetical protein